MGFLSGVLGSVAGGLVSGLFGKEASEDQAQSVREQQAANYAQQKEFAQHGIRWRVADAKKAGLHPLYALGGSGLPSYAPNPIVPMGGEMAQMGQDISRAVTAAATSGERTLQEAQLEALEAASAKDRAQAAYWAAESAKSRQDALASASIPNQGDVAGLSGSQDPADYTRDPETGAIVWKGSREPSAGFITSVIVPGQAPFIMPRPGDMAQRPLSPGESFTQDVAREKGPMWGEWNLDSRGLKIQLPAASNPSEALESLSESWPLLVATVARNRAVYGERWTRDALLSIGVSEGAIARALQEAGNVAIGVAGDIGRGAVDYVLGR